MRDRNFSGELGIPLWHFIVGIPCMVLAVFAGKRIAETVRTTDWANLPENVTSRIIKAFEAAPAPKPKHEVREEKMWMKDDFFEAEIGTGVACPFARFSALDELGEPDDSFTVSDEMQSRPFVIQGLMDTWPATRSDRWQRYKLLRTYGKKTIAANTQTSIIYGGGNSRMKFSSFSRAVKDMRRSEEEGEDRGDQFVFDSSILQSIPELKNDIDDPELFSSWWGGGDSNANANGNGKGNKHSWHILSLGASRTGLPFHSHGATWLGLVHGLKKWYIYPPGTGPPRSVYNDTRLLVPSVKAWLRDVLPTLSELPVAPLNSVDDDDDDDDDDVEGERGHRPIEYVQVPGEILYLPAGWAHQTINIGEAIGFGSQTPHDLAHKAALADRALQRSPHNVQALKMKAVSLVQSAMAEEARVKYNISAATLNGLVRISGSDGNDDFSNLVLQGEDTWLLYVLPPTAKSTSDEDSRQWNEMAGKLKGVLSVGMVEPSSSLAAAAAAAAATAWGTEGQQQPKILLSFGDRPSGQNAADAMQAAFVAEYTGDKGDSEAIMAFALQGLAERGPRAGTGSATTVGAKACRLYAEAEDRLRSALEVDPTDPEAHTILCEALGHAGKRNQQQDASQAASEVYERLLARGMLSVRAVAGLFHQLGECYLGTDKPQEALPLLDRSITVAPRYYAAHVDKVTALGMLGDEQGIQMALEQAENAGLKRDHPELRRVLAAHGGGGKVVPPRRDGVKPPPGKKALKKKSNLHKNKKKTTDGTPSEGNGNEL
jgi:tetratricopeptide (TPR) repeat protein